MRASEIDGKLSQLETRAANSDHAILAIQDSLEQVKVKLDRLHDAVSSMSQRVQILWTIGATIAGGIFSALVYVLRTKLGL